jgi:hypothetical protein
MIKIICVFLFSVNILGVCFAQEQQENVWKGTVRFDTADNFINLHNALPGMSVTWTPYILPNLGIPAELDVHVGWGVLPGTQISLLSGVEYIMIGPSGRDKNGFLLSGKIGMSLFIYDGAEIALITKAGAGYQLITRRGFVFSPAVGAVYNGRTGFGLNIMLDLGFAYR